MPNQGRSLTSRPPCSVISELRLRRMRGRSRVPPDLQELRLRMVEQQLRARDLTDERVLAAMARVRRELFVPERLRDRAYDDEAPPIAGVQTIAQPFRVA